MWLFTSPRVKLLNGVCSRTIFWIGFKVIWFHRSRDTWFSNNSYVWCSGYNLLTICCTLCAAGSLDIIVVSRILLEKNCWQTVSRAFKERVKEEENNSSWGVDNILRSPSILFRLIVDETDGMEKIYFNLYANTSPTIFYSLVFQRSMHNNVLTPSFTLPYVSTYCWAKG